MGLRPLYVQREDHASGMVCPLSLTLRVLTLVEHVLREGLQAAGEALKGLYPGGPRRQTARPTTERLVKDFPNRVSVCVLNILRQTWNDHLGYKFSPSGAWGWSPLPGFEKLRLAYKKQKDLNLDFNRGRRRPMSWQQCVGRCWRTSWQQG